MTPKRVLIIRLSAIGDVVFASPLINACRQTHPDATIDWLCEPVAAPLLSGHPNLNEIIICQGPTGRACGDQVVGGLLVNRF